MMTNVPTFKDFLLSEAHRLWEGRHLQQSRDKMLRFCEFEDFGSRKIDSFKPADIHRYMDDLSKTISANTVNHYAAAISVVFNHAVDEEFIGHAPKIKWKKVKSGRPRYFTKDEREALMNFDWGKHDWIKHFVTIGLHTGMRLGEILMINPEMIKEDDDGDVWVHLPKTKNGDERWVPVSAPAREALAQLADEPSLLYSHRTFYDSWDAARHKIAKGDKTFVFHVLRHTAASTMANELSVNTVLIGQILGHKQQSTTAKYVHAKPKTVQSIARQLASI